MVNIVAKVPPIIKGIFKAMHKEATEASYLSP
jgi:hypothetical protein